jgi:hypothetical protein
MINGFKGFDKNMRCRGYQFETGKKYTEKRAKACEAGFHFCEFPLDVFNYYGPVNSRYCEVEGDGDIDKHNDDSKVACTHIRIGAEIGLPGLISAGVKFILDRVDWKNAKESNTGYQSAATNTGDQSAATNTGDWSAACVEGKESVAMAIGYQSKAKGALGCWIVLSEWTRDDNGDWHIVDVKSAKVDGKTILADTWYKLVDGQFVECGEEV